MSLDAASSETGGNAEALVQRIANCQGRLYAFIRALLPDAELAKDVLQETNLVLWRKRSQFVEGSDFGAWACSIARYQVLAQIRDRARDRHLFDEELLGQLSSAVERQTEQLEQRATALRHCMKKLPTPQRDAVERRYQSALSVQGVAERLGKSPAAVASLLQRARRSLLECIERTLSLGRSI